jgi:NifU-like protein
VPWDYSDKVRKLFLDAIRGEEGSHLGELADADGRGQHGSIACGDAMEFAFRVEKDPEDPRKDRIVRARYRTFGCTSAIASSEALCRMIEDRKPTPVEALKVRNADIVEYLDGLPSQKLHCSVMGAEALQAAIVDWARRRGVPLPELGIDPEQLAVDEGRIVCRCFALTEPYIRRKILEMSLRTVDELTGAIKAGGACTSCRQEPGGLQDLLDEIWGKQPGTVPQPRAPSSPKIARTPYQLAKEIDRVLDSQVRPQLAAEGGDIEVVDIRDKKVFCRLRGACAGCAGARQTLRFVVEDALREAVDPEIRVFEV